MDFDKIEFMNRITSTVNNHVLSLSDACLLVESLAPYCDDRTVDGFLQWVRRMWNKETWEDMHCIKINELHLIKPGDILWVEYRDDEYTHPVEFEKISVFTYSNGEEETCIYYSIGMTAIEDYNKTYRFWFAKPSKEQRGLEKWE